MRPARTRPALATLLVAALIAACALVTAGCGSSSSSSHSATGIDAALQATGTAPSGATTYRGAGFTLAVPAGWKRYDTGRGLIQWTPPSSRIAYSVQVLSGSRQVSGPTQLSQMQAANKLEKSNIRMSSFALSHATVPGAQAAWLITARGSSPKGPHRIDDLLVKTSSGGEIELSVTQLPGAASFDSLAYLRSLKLTGGGATAPTATTSGATPS